MITLRYGACAWTRLLLLTLLVTMLPTLARADTRTFTFDYDVTITPTPETTPLLVFLPLASNNEQQTVLEEDIRSPVAGVIETEPTYGNRFWRGTVSNTGPVTITVSTTVERRGDRLQAPAHSRALSAEERQGFARLLAPDRLVPVGHEILQPILAEVRARAGSDDPAALARAIYDWVVDNVEYKKVGTGWGNGDTFWACTARYGNCTDFHALFISLARSVGIPARFEIGFPVPLDQPAGNIAGYHCWVEFYLPETGWFPIDASEAFKHSEQRDFLFGGHPTNRIQFSTGRDLRLGEAHRGPALNYFVYPYLEANGQPVEGQAETSFSYR